MFASPIPTYSIVATRGLGNPKSGDDIPISQRSLSPLDTNIPDNLITLLEHHLKEYVFSLKEEKPPLLKARFSFSQKDGIEVLSTTDERIRAIIKGEELGAAMLVSEAVQQGTLHLKRLKPDIKTIQDMEAKLGGPAIFTDTFAVLLWQKRIEGRINLEVEVDYRTALSQGGELTTGPLRYPHLWRHLFEQKKKNQSDISTVVPSVIGMVGPGMIQDKGSPFCPQFIELLALFPETQFELFDNDKTALEIMNKQFKVCKLAFYDPSMLTLRTCKNLRAGLYAPKKYQPTLRKIKEVIAKKTLLPKNVNAILDGQARIEKITLKLESDKIKVRDFDIITSKFGEEENKKFDFLVATFSINLALRTLLEQDRKQNPFNILVKFLLTLKENGTLYLDTSLREQVLQDRYGEKGLNLGIRYMQSILGNCIRLEEIPFSDFDPQNVNHVGVISSITIEGAKEFGYKQNVGTSSITAMTRTSDKFVVDEEKKETIKLELMQWIEYRASQKDIQLTGDEIIIFNDEREVTDIKVDDKTLKIVKS